VLPTWQALLALDPTQSAKLVPFQAGANSPGQKVMVEEPSPTRVKAAQ
jgi:hypothetical protein